jgi:hypothetical protein
MSIQHPKMAAPFATTWMGYRETDVPEEIEGLGLGLGLGSGSGATILDTYTTGCVVHASEEHLHVFLVLIHQHIAIFPHS